MSGLSSPAFTTGHTQSFILTPLGKLIWKDRSDMTKYGSRAGTRWVNTVGGVVWKQLAAL